jgi:hypothetical protein
MPSIEIILSASPPLTGTLNISPDHEKKISVASGERDGREAKCRACALAAKAVITDNSRRVDFFIV